MSDLLEFLRARLDEDEQAAEGARGSWKRGPALARHADASVGDVFRAANHVAAWAPSRVLAEVAAKRKLIDLAEEATGLDMLVDNDRLCSARDMIAEPYAGDLILRALVQPYAAHPEFDPSWEVGQ